MFIFIYMHLMADKLCEAAPLGIREKNKDLKKVINMGPLSAF